MRIVKVSLHVITNSSMWNTESDNYVQLLTEAWGGLMVSALDSGASNPGSSPGWAH